MTLARKVAGALRDLPNSKAVARFDHAVDGHFEAHLRGEPALDRLMYTASAAGDHSMIWLALAALQGPVSGKGWRPLLRAGALLGAESALVNGPVKMAFRRERPEVTGPHPLPLRTPLTSSFPSGHASAAFFAAALLRSGSSCTTYYSVATIVASSRVHVRMHHASDVIAGALLGAGLGELARGFPAAATAALNSPRVSPRTMRLRISGEHDEHRPAHRLAGEPTGSERNRTLWWELLAVFAISLVLSTALFHRAWVWPFSTLIGSAGDADEYTWFLAWVPFAIGHGLDPLVSSYVSYPGGVNLMWNTSVLLPSFLMTPVTAIFGAAFSYNALVTLAPVLNTTFGYMAFRRWTGRLPALFGALVFGFSPYVVTQSVGHLAQTLLVSAPLMLIVLDRLVVTQSRTPWVDGLVLGLLAWAQLLTGEEVLAMEAVTAAIAMAVLYAIARRHARPYFAYALRGGLIAGGVFAVLSAPFLAVQYLGPYRVQDVHPRNVYVNDLLNFFVPTHITQLAPAAALRVSSHFTGNGSEQSAYIGTPLVLFMILTLVLARHRTVTWVALALTASAAVLSMGQALHVAGHVTHIYLPEYLLKNLPVFHNLLPDRFSSMMALGAGLLVAVGLDQLRRLREPAMVSGWALAGVGLVALLPTFHFAASASPPLGAFNTGFSCPKAAPAASPKGPPDVLLLPAVNELNLRWQAETGFCFVMPTSTGMTGTNSRGRQAHGALFEAGSPSTPVPPRTAAARQEAAQEIQSLGIDEIVVSPQSPAQPLRTMDDQAQLVAWVEWLLGQAPRQSRDDSISYVWASLPPTVDIASGKVATVPGGP